MLTYRSKFIRMIQYFLTIFVLLLIILISPAQTVLSAPIAALTLHVDTTTDNPALTTCNDLGPVDCSLRGAISHVNGDTGNEYVISIPSGTYVLNTNPTPVSENANNEGDLDINHPNLTLQGQRITDTIIDGNGTDRVIDQLGSEDILTINDLTITNGQLENGEGGGAGIRVEVVNHLTLNHVTVNHNVTGSSEDGGGIFGKTGATLTINSSTINDNHAQDGGGIAASFCQLFISVSIIDDNHAGGVGGGIASVAGGTTINVDRSVIQSNTANNGGGIANTSASSLTIIDSTIKTTRLHSTAVD